MSAQMLQQAESGEKNEKLLEKNGSFSRKGKEGKWVIELQLQGQSRGLRAPWSGLTHMLGMERQNAGSRGNAPLRGRKGSWGSEISEETQNLLLERRRNLLVWRPLAQDKRIFFFFPLIPSGNLNWCYSEQNWGSCKGSPERIPGDVSGGSPHFGAELSWDSLSSRENDLYSTVWLGWGGGRNQGARLRREGSGVMLQGTRGILATTKSSSASSP